MLVRMVWGGQWLLLAGQPTVPSPHKGSEKQSQSRGIWCSTGAGEWLTGLLIMLYSRMG